MLLPSDRYIAELLGLTEEQYEYWRDQVRLRQQQGPQPAATAGIEISIGAILLNVILSVGFTLLAALLTPSPKRNTPARLTQRDISGQSQTSSRAFAPRAGFDSVQEPASMGDPIPAVYANQENIGGVLYGGVRVNLSLLWCQATSTGRSQLLRALFMVSEGPIGALNPAGFAIGNNPLTSYDFTVDSANQAASRITIYFRPDGGRIASGDRIAGRAAANDPGNAQNSGAADVFMVRGSSGAWAADFSASSKPSTSTSFGLYAPIGHNLAFKLNPTVRPLYNARLVPRGDDGDGRVVCDIDRIVEVDRQKNSATFSSRSGVTSGSFGLGDTFTYTLDRSSDFDTVFTSSNISSSTWTASFEVSPRPVIFVQDSSTQIADSALPWEDWLTLSAVTASAAGDGFELTATFNVDSANVALLNANAAAGQYTAVYKISITSTETGEVVQSVMRVNVDVQRRRNLVASSDASGSTFVDYSINQSKNGEGLVTNVSLTEVGANNISVTTTISDQAGNPFTTAFGWSVVVDADSGPIQTLTGPTRIAADIVFPINDLDAYTEKAGDVASAVAGRQRAWDNAIVVGDLYKFGSAIAVCVARSPDDAVFVSDADNEAAGSGQTITATFRVVQAGSATLVSLADLQRAGTDPLVFHATGTNGPHLSRLAIATVATTTECNVVELGIRSTMGQSINGLMNFRDTLTLEEADGRACLLREGDTVKRGKQLFVDRYQSGFINLNTIERYSFHRISWREHGSTGAFTELSGLFGFRGLGNQSVFNSIRLEFSSARSREIRIIPVSGWEIRSGVAAGDLYLVDSKIQGEVSGSSGGVTWRAKGQVLVRDRSVFTIEATRRPNPGMGYPRIDENNYADAWGRLAEQFVYEEMSSSTGQGPEHEIVYVNEIRSNATVPTYDGIALVGINASSSFEWTQFSQLSGYVTQGIEARRLLSGLTEGATHLFPDIALDRFTNPKYSPGRVIDASINFDSFEESATWCQGRKYFYDGPVNIADGAIRQWVADTAAAFLLTAREVNGLFELRPAITFDPVEWACLFTAGNIAEGTWKWETPELDDRQPYQVSVTWRQERGSSDPLAPGLFPQVREVLVREAAPYASDSDPIDQIDLSDFCTNEQHAIDVAKFVIRMRRIRGRGGKISFQTTYDGVEGLTAGIGPGSYIRVALEGPVFSSFANGAVLADGTLVSTETLTPGTYAAITWDGSDADPATGNIVVAADGKATPTGVIFTRVNSTVETFEILDIRPTQLGTYEIEAVHMPTEPDGTLSAVADWDDPAAWVIQS